MRRILILFALIAPVFTLSCEVDNVKEVPMPPPAIALQITAINNMATPVTIRMRHVYCGSWTSGRRVYSDWITVPLAAGDSQLLGGETVEYHYKGNNGTMSGFILWDNVFIDSMKYSGDSSSFELEIQTAAAAIVFAGYKTADALFAETGLGDLKIALLGPPGGWLPEFFYEDQDSLIAIPYVINANLTINADGTYSFEYTNLDGHGVFDYP
jgi:hypothetical protein